MTMVIIRVTYEWHTNDIDYIQATYECHTNTYKWHKNDIRVHMWVTFKWHASPYEWHTNEIQADMSDMRVYTGDLGFHWAVLWWV